MFKVLFRARALEKENEKLKKLNAVRADIISINAHQLRTSLTAMKWTMKMFMDEDLGPVSAEQKEYLDTCYDRNERMIKLVTEMLDVNKKGEMSDEYHFEKASLAELIEDTLVDFAGEAQKKEIGFIDATDTKLPEVLMDADKIRIVFQNLVENALKYSDAGKSVTVSARPVDSSVEVTVADEGIGISKLDQERIFSKYFRADNAKQKGPTGSGIGLFTTKHIIEEHGGSIWFESEKGKGTAFHFTLPVA